MLNPRALALAVVTVGAGGVLFLSSGQNPASPVPAPVGPVPVALPPTATQVETPEPAVPVAQPVAAPSSTRPAPTPRPTPKRQQAASTPARKVAPKRIAPAPVVTQQPQPADTEPNGSGGWQLPACYDPSCVADPNMGTGTEALNAGPLGQAGIVNEIPRLMGGH